LSAQADATHQVFPHEAPGEHPAGAASVRGRAAGYSRPASPRGLTSRARLGVAAMHRSHSASGFSSRAF